MIKMKYTCLLVFACLFTCCSSVKIKSPRNSSTVNLGEALGHAKLIDEIVFTETDTSHLFAESPAGASAVKTILGKPTRLLNKTPGEAAYMTFRLGRNRNLRAGGTYILEVEYPEDVPRSLIVQNAGNESALGFHTGTTVGDAFHPKYVSNNNESLNLPLSGKIEKWRQLFNLHDRFPNVKYIRGSGGRPLTVKDGFSVTIFQFSAENLPLSQGAAVSAIRLYEVPDPEALKAKINLPPAELPHRNIFWREEMSDGVVNGAADKTTRGLDDPIDWFRFKANQMDFLGINTYTKDLLEFGAVQNWNTSAGGGGQWANYDAPSADWWNQIVEIMGNRGFRVLPYYEYAGSKGKQGLGNERRAKPLTRDDAFTKTSWIENANADITDPDTYADFKKMLDITVIALKDKANFAGIWLRPRMQLPMGFGDATRQRFATEANKGQTISRQDLIRNAALLARYKDWWFGKRQEFLVAMRDYLRANGINDAVVLFTADATEPGVPLKGSNLVTDNLPLWNSYLDNSNHSQDKNIKPITLQQVVDQQLYLQALTSPIGTWGGWEVQHAGPQPDPRNYQNVEGVMLTHTFNTLYSVSDPQTMDLFRTKTGLTMIRHHSLNENMMFDANGKEKLGYFVVDVERAGPYCMMSEAMAMANGDPTHLGYLLGLNLGRGFPEYVRNFNTAFLSLPALPSVRLSGAANDSEVVVRSINTDKYGTYFAVVNTGMTNKKNVQIALPPGKVTDATTGKVLQTAGSKVTLNLYPYQLRALHVD